MITQKLLRDVLDYNPETGVFTWKIDQSKRAKKGVVAGSNWKYTLIGINKGRYYAHRLAWIYVYGDFIGHIDHINEDKNDNRISNLRLCDKPRNMQNRGKQVNNTSGFKGVTFSKQTGKWIVQIWAFGKKQCIGGFITPEAAYKKYLELSKDMHGEFSIAHKAEYSL